MKPLYRIRKTQDGDFYWIFQMKNNRTSLTSKTYISHDECVESVKISKDHLDKNCNLIIKKTENNKYYFNQITDHGEELARSIYYANRQGAKKSIQIMIEDAPTAKILENKKC